MGAFPPSPSYIAPLPSSPGSPGMSFHEPRHRYSGVGSVGGGGGGYGGQVYFPPGGRGGGSPGSSAYPPPPGPRGSPMAGFERYPAYLRDKEVAAGLAAGSLVEGTLQVGWRGGDRSFVIVSGLTHNVSGAPRRARVWVT